jgi:hypothetical protein
VALLALASDVRREHWKVVVGTYLRLFAVLSVFCVYFFLADVHSHRVPGFVASIALASDVRREYRTVVVA